VWGNFVRRSLPFHGKRSTAKGAKWGKPKAWGRIKGALGGKSAGKARQKGRRGPGSGTEAGALRCCPTPQRGSFRRGEESTTSCLTGTYRLGNRRPFSQGIFGQGRVLAEVIEWGGGHQKAKGILINFPTRQLHRLREICRCYLSSNAQGIFPGWRSSRAEIRGVKGVGDDRPPKLPMVQRPWRGTSRGRARLEK